MAYIKAYITDRKWSKSEGNKHTKRKGGFFTNSIVSVSENEDGRVKIFLPTVGTAEQYLHQRYVTVDLPIDQVNELMAQLELEGGVLDLLEATDPKLKGQPKKKPEIITRFHKRPMPVSAKQLAPSKGHTL